ncbi:hypothetical protein JCM8547_004692 [Rhodosporidiobolus lusitaniae]
MLLPVLWLLLAVYRINTLQIPLVPPRPAASSLLPTGNGFDHFAQGLLDEWGVPGVAVGLFKVEEDGEASVEFRSYGEAGRGRRVDEHTLFGIASNTKAFTAAAVGKLVDEGVFNWSSKASSLSSAFELYEDFASEKATMVDLLSHRSGLPRHEHSYRVGQTAEELVKNMRYLKPSAELRETFHQPFIFASRIVSNFTSQPFTSRIRSSILEPLNMTSTTFSPHLDGPAILDKLSASYLTLENKTVVEIPYGFNYSREDLELNAAAGGIVSSTRDMIKWVELLIRQRRRATSHNTTSSPIDSTLSPSTILKLTTPQTIASRRASVPGIVSPQFYGVGFFQQWYNDEEYIYHGGDIPGFGSQVAWSSEKGVGVVALANSDGAGNAVADMLCYQAFDLLLKRNPYDWRPYYRKRAEVTLIRRAAALALALSHTHSTIPPSLPPSSYLGTYSAPGYGVVELCPVCSSPSPSSSPLTVSSTCAALSARLSEALPLSSSPLPPPHFPTPAFLLNWPGFFSASHVLLRHFEEEVWKGSFASVFDGVEGENGEGRKMVQYEEADAVRVEFVLEEDGDGRKSVSRMDVSGVWGAGGEVEEDETRVEVSFERLS